MKGSFFDLIYFKGILLLNWTFVQGPPEDIGKGMRVDSEEDNGRSIHLKKKQYDYFPQFGPVESS